MRITDEVVRAMQNCVDSLGSLAEFSRRTGVRIEMISRSISRQTKSLNQDTWGQIYPILKPYLNAAGEKGEPPKIVGQPARMHKDLVSLTSDEKVLLDAFAALDRSEQQKFLKLLLDSAEMEIAKKRGEV